MLEKECDVLVAGGGVSGVCAAIASARNGMKTALIQNRPVLGGNSSSEIRVWTRGAVGGGNIYAEEMGILGELKLANLHTNPQGNPVLWDEILLDKVLAEKNLDLYLNTELSNVVCDKEGTITQLYAHMQGSETDYCFRASMVVDATGDGVIGALAGVKYRVGREDKNQYGESLGIDGKDSNVLGSSIFFQTKETDAPVEFIKPDYAYDMDTIEKILQKGGGRIVNDKMNGCDYWWMEFGGTMDTIRENQDIYLELKRLVMGVWNYIKNSGKFAAENLTLEWVGNIPGKRESRRFTCNYTLTQKDLEEQKTFQDAVAYGGWYMDFHPSEGIYSQETFCTQIPVFAYGIPLRCLYSEDCKNLLFAGRNISVSHAAFSSTRVMNTCGLEGQAAGEIAAFCVDMGINTGQLEQHREEIRQRLLKNDAGAIDTRNCDPGDLVAKADITESDHRIIGEVSVNGYLPIQKGCFVICPGMEQAKELELVIRCKKNTRLSWRIYHTNLPNRFLTGKFISEETVSVSTDQTRLKISLAGKEISYGKIVFEENPWIELAVTDTSLTGFLAGYESSPHYMTPCVTSYGDIYSCREVTNGYNRPFKKVNLWVSGNLKQTQFLKFTWEKPVKIKEIRVTLNPGLDKELPSSITIGDNPHHMFVKRKGEAEELVKAFDIYTVYDRCEKKVAEIRNNFQRMCVVHIPETPATEMKLVFLETYGSDYAEVFEVRVY